jgi:hypothetical protein
MAEDFTDSPDLQLVPADRAEIISADEALDAAEASALDDPLSATATTPPAIPFGRTAPFDYATGRFVRLGDGAVPWVSGKAALREWIYASLQTGRGGCPLYDDSVGFERPNDFLGTVDPSESMSTLEERLRDCVLVHDRIEDIDDYEAEHDPRSGVIEITDLTIITDEAEAVVVGNFDATGGI